MPTGIKYVSPTGNNGNSGDDWATAKAAVAAAVKALPIYDGGTPAQRHCGVVNIAPGFYVETDTPIPFHAGLQIVGSGNTFNTTTIQLGNNKNTALFSWRETVGLTTESGNPPPYTDYLHGAALKNLYLLGNKANNATAPPLVRLLNGGAACVLQDLYVRDAKDFGLYVQRNALTLRLLNVNFSRCDGGALDFRHDGTSSTNLLWISGEVDDCAIGGANKAPIRIRQNGSGQINNILHFQSVKCETNAGLNAADSMFRFEPHTATSNPLHIQIDSCNGINNDVTFPKTALIYEANGVGAGARWTILNSACGGQWTKLFRSDKTGVQLDQTFAHLFASNGGVLVEASNAIRINA